MIIEKIVIKSFGPLTDVTLEFSDKLNVIEGQNEAGKSTIAAFIKYMLYGFEGSDSEEALMERRRRINWYTGTAQGSMYVRVKDKRYLISRSTTPTDNSARPTYKEESSIVDMENGTPAFGKLPAGEVFFGVDRDLFDNTAFIGQIYDSGINEDTVKASIENILFSGSEKINHQRAVARISDKMQALFHENGNGGAIFDLMNREAELEDRLAACEEDNRQILAKEAELHRIRARRAEAEDRLEKFHDLDISYSNVMLIQTFDQLHALEEECDQKTEAYNTFIKENTKAGFVPDEQYLTDLAVARKGVNEAYHALGEAQNAYTEQRNAVGITREIEGAIELSDTMGGEKQVQAKAEKLFFKQIKTSVAAGFGAIVALAALVFEIIFASNPDNLPKILVGIGGGLALAAAGYMGFELWRSIRTLRDLQKQYATETYQDLKGKLTVIGEARAKRDAIITATESAKQSAVGARERYEAAQRTLTELILKWGEEPPVSELNEFLDALENKVRTFLTEKNALAEAKTEIEITVKEIRRTLADKSEIDVRAQVAPFKRKAMAGVNHDEIITGIAAAKAAIAEEDRLAFDVENELMLLKGRAGDPGEYYSRIRNVADRREALQNKHRAFCIAQAAIRGAADNLRAEISPRLGEYATRMMEIMTDKKYSAFDVSDGLKVSFRDPTGESKSVDFLSGGTRDMAYVAVRAALIDMLYTEKPPVCFDETFAHQDNVRARSMMKAVAKLADEGCQSFIFTCRGREATLATEQVPTAGVFKLSVVEEERV